MHLFCSAEPNAAASLGAQFPPTNVCRSFNLHWLQDTNALVFRALLAALGLSAANDYDMNSLAVPRKAKEAIGAIARLDKADGSGSMTVNVEYNQLDPLLRSTINKDGDVNDATGALPHAQYSVTFTPHQSHSTCCSCSAAVVLMITVVCFHCALSSSQSANCPLLLLLA